MRNMMTDAMYIMMTVHPKLEETQSHIVHHILYIRSSVEDSYSCSVRAITRTTVGTCLNENCLFSTFELVLYDRETVWFAE